MSLIETKIKTEQRVKWRQIDNILYLYCNEGRFFWEMPSYWKLKDVHKDLLFLVECLLFHSFYPEQYQGLIDRYDFTRKQGKKVGLSFSGGIDSTTAFCIAPKDTVLFYHQRKVSMATAFKPDNHLRLFEIIKKKTGRETTAIISSMDEIRYKHGFQCGMPSTYATGVGMILCADYLDLGYYGLGTQLESVYLHEGRKFVDYQDKFYSYFWKRLFERAGLPLYLPIAGCAKPAEFKILKDNGLLDYTFGCNQGTGGAGCGKWWKCFKRNSITGEPYDLDSDQLKKYFDIKPFPPMLTTFVYVAQKTGDIDKIDILKPYKDMDCSWQDKFYPEFIDLIPTELKEHTIKEITEYLKPMDKPYIFKEVDFYAGKYPKKS